MQTPQSVATLQDPAVTKQGIHQLPSLKSIEQVEPKAYKLMRLKANAMKKEATGTLTVQDSIKLNLLDIYEDKGTLFNSNGVTRSLHPVDSMSFQYSNIALNDSLSIVSDSLVLGDTTLVDIPVARTEVPVTIFPEKPVPAYGLSGYLIWLGPVLLFATLLAALVKSFSGNYLSLLFKAVFNQQHANNFYKMVNVRRSLPSYGLDLLFIISFGLFIQLGVVVVGGGSIMSPLILLVICGAIFLLMMIKTAVYRYVAFVFNIGEEALYFQFYVFLYTRVGALFLFPIVIVMAFADQWLSVGMLAVGGLLLIIVYLMQILQGVKIFLRYPSLLFYMFLYLCALEILPILIAFKALYR